MSPAHCPDCGWTQDYARPTAAKTGLERHQNRNCGPPWSNTAARAKAQAVRQERERDTEAARWTVKAQSANLTPERTPAEWMAHPYALDDLLRVVCGTPLNAIAYERKLLRDLAA